MQREVVRRSLTKKWRQEQFGVCFEKLIGHKKKKKREDCVICHRATSSIPSYSLQKAS